MDHTWGFIAYTIQRTAVLNRIKTNLTKGHRNSSANPNSRCLNTFFWRRWRLLQPVAAWQPAGVRRYPRSVFTVCFNVYTTCTESIMQKQVQWYQLTMDSMTECTLNVRCWNFLCSIDFFFKSNFLLHELPFHLFAWQRSEANELSTVSVNWLHISTYVLSSYSIHHNIAFTLDNELQKRASALHKCVN